MMSESLMMRELFENRDSFATRQDSEMRALGDLRPNSTCL